MGKVIGRRGRVAQSIRSVVRAAGARRRRRRHRRHRRLSVRADATGASGGRSARPPASRSARSSGPTGLRGQVVVELWTNRDRAGRAGRRAVGSAGRRAARSPRRRARPVGGPGAVAGVPSAGSTTARRPRRCGDAVLAGAPDRRRRRAVGARADRRRGRRRRTARRSAWSTRSRPTRPATCSCSTTGALIPLRFVIDRQPRPVDGRPARRACSTSDRRRAGSTGRAHRRVHHFPRLWSRRGLDASLIGKAGRAGSARPAGPRPARRGRRSPPVGRRQPVRRRRGMVLAPEPLFAAVEAVDPPRPAAAARPGRPPLRPGLGRASWPAGGGFSLLCGRYEGVDQRVADHLVDGELSIGDFVLAGGEVAALVVIEAVARLVPGSWATTRSADEESFADGLLEYPQYTRPADVPGLGGARGAALAATTRRVAALAPGPGPGPDPRAPARPDRGPRRAEPRRSGPAGRVRRSTATIARTLFSLEPPAGAPAP